MKQKSLFFALLMMFACVVMAQVESGKVYRIVSGKYNTVITEGPATHEMTCVAEGTDNDYQQMWKFTLEEDGKYSIMNVFTGRYIRESSDKHFKTSDSKSYFEIKENTELGGYYNIDASGKEDGWGLHCDAQSAVVHWSNGPDKNGLSGSEWIFKELTITEEDIAKAQEDYAIYNAVVENIDEIETEVTKFFKDNAATELKDEYQTMSDDDLLKEMAKLPVALQNVVLKVKNNSWAPCEDESLNLGEKDFRIYEYKPYSDVEKWMKKLYTRLYSPIDNPTGICTNSGKDFIYVFVDEIPAGTTIKLAEMLGTGYFGEDTDLKEGVNIIPEMNKDGVLYIKYICDTDNTEGGKKLEDYPRVKIHIEGGYVNGFWSKERGHENAHWAYMKEHMFKNPASIQVKGDIALLNFRKKEFLEACPVKIKEVLAYWDFWNKTQHKYMDLPKYYPWFNNMQLAMSDDTGFMDAGNHRTHYNNNTLSGIACYEVISTNAGQAWGPMHEIGHNNQYVFEIVGTSEVSNNALANMTTFETGTHTSRGQNMTNQILSYEKGIPYVLRGESKYGSQLFSMTRMYYQLFLYFHAAGFDTQFYQKLFERLRYDRLVGWSTGSQCSESNAAKDYDHDNDATGADGYVPGSMNAVNDQLKFVEVCCEIANMDLTEFFEAWGFFIPMKNDFVGDYGHHHVYLTQEEIDACKARIAAKNYPKKGGHLMFIEDRVRAPKQRESEMNPNPSGNRGSYANWVGEMIGQVGDVGQWEDYIDTSVKAQGYYYTSVNNEITIMEAEGAGGALGFKMYDAETGKLLTFSNNKKEKTITYGGESTVLEGLTVPVSYIDRPIRIVAAQADGNDVEVLPASQGPESMQRNALYNSLDEAWYYTFLIANSGNEVGYFYKDAVEYITTLYEDAKKAYDEKDTSVHSYAEWSALLDDECNRLKNAYDARIFVEEGDLLTLLVPGRGKLLRRVRGVGALSSADILNEMLWSIEYVSPNEYYLKCDGKYVDDFEIGDIITCNQVVPNENAARFSIKYNNDGSIYLVSGDKALGIASRSTELVDGSPLYNIVGVSASSNEIVKLDARIQERNSERVYKEELDKMLLEASFVITEVMKQGVGDNLAPVDDEVVEDEEDITETIFNENVIIRDRNLETYIIDLYNLYCTVVADIDNTSMYKEYLNSLRVLIGRIEGTYIVASPIDTKNSRIVMYRLYDIDNDNYLGISTSVVATYPGRLTKVSEAALDDNALWAFIPTGKLNEYKMYNIGAGAYLTMNGTSRQLYAVKNQETLPVTLTFDSERNAVILRANGKNVYSTSSYVNLDTYEPACWELDLAVIEDDEEKFNDIITRIENLFEEGNYDEDFYDLSGRRVANPTKGIYIQNGRKVYHK